MMRTPLSAGNGFAGTLHEVDMNPQTTAEEILAQAFEVAATFQTLLQYQESHAVHEVALVAARAQRDKAEQEQYQQLLATYTQISGVIQTYRHHLAILFPDANPDERFSRAWSINAVVQSMSGRRFDSYSAYVLGEADQFMWLKVLRTLLPVRAATAAPMVQPLKTGLLLPTRVRT